MSKRGRVFVERENGRIVRLFRSRFKALECKGDVVEYPRHNAVVEIRQQVYERSKGYCENCGHIITHTFHMHEKIARSDGGEISLENSVALCAACHILRTDSEHGNRRLRFGEANG